MSLVVKNLKETPANNVQAFIDLTLLNCKLKGVYQYQAIAGTTPETRTQILVMPTDTEPQGMSLVELITEINNMIQSFGGGEPVTAEDMKETLNSMGLKSIEAINVEIRQLFIYTDSSSVEAKTKPCEYAFNFVITNHVDPSESLKIFHIDQLGFAVYNTNRKKIIERMQLEDIAELLA